MIVSLHIPHDENMPSPAPAIIRYRYGLSTQFFDIKINFEFSGSLQTTTNLLPIQNLVKLSLKPVICSMMLNKSMNVLFVVINPLKILNGSSGTSLTYSLSRYIFIMLCDIKMIINVTTKSTSTFILHAFSKTKTRN